MRRVFASIVLLLACHNSSGFTLPCLESRAHRSTAHALQGASHDESTETNSRRSFILGAGILSTQLSYVFSSGNQPAWAEDGGDMTKQLFNEDGSLKEGEVEEAKFRTVDIAWADLSESEGKYLFSIDGKASDSGSKVRLSYKVPEKWQQDSDGYYDKSTTGTLKACERITVYRAPFKVNPEQLVKAATIGIGEALYVPEDLKILKKADLLSGKTRKQGDLMFYDFDMASAPKECEMSPENLGLGFCPFNSIYLISAVVVDDALYVLAAACDKSEWKVANADLKRVRSSFSVNLA